MTGWTIDVSKGMAMMFNSTMVLDALRFFLFFFGLL